MTDEIKLPDAEEGTPEVLEKEGPMAELMKTAGKPPAFEDVVEGPVVAKSMTNKGAQAVMSKTADTTFNVEAPNS